MAHKKVTKQLFQNYTMQKAFATNKAALYTSDFGISEDCLNKVRLNSPEKLAYPTLPIISYDKAWKQG